MIIVVVFCLAASVEGQNPADNPALADEECLAPASAPGLQVERIFGGAHSDVDSPDGTRADGTRADGTRADGTGSADTTYSIDQSQIELGRRPNGFEVRVFLPRRPPGPVRLAHRLTPLEETWREQVHGEGPYFIHYAHLPAGRVALEVRWRLDDAPEDAPWSATTSLPVVVPFAPWASRWALAVYGFAACLLLVAYLGFQHRRARNQRRHNAELERLAQRRSAALTDASVELRAPLLGLAGLAEDLLRDHQSRLDAASERTVSRLAASSRRLAGTVGELLDQTLLAHRELTLQPAELDLRQLTKRVLGELQPAVGESVALVNVVTKDVPRARGDIRRIEQVLGRLVTLAADRTRAGRVEVDAGVKEAWIEMRVRDNGLAIGDEGSWGIIGPADAQAVTMEVCSGLVALHGGELTIESTPGSGTVARFTLPSVSAPFNEGTKPGQQQTMEAGTRA